MKGKFKVKHKVGEKLTQFSLEKNFRKESERNTEKPKVI